MSEAGHSLDDVILRKLLGGDGQEAADLGFPLIHSIFKNDSS